MITLLITFDYELPLGGVSSYKKGLFEPSEKLIELGNDLNVPFVFFADICSAIQFKDWDFEGYYKPFTEQMQRAIRTNHDVQLHIHPHWLTSTYKNNHFFPSQDFSLGSFKNHDKLSISNIISESSKQLNLICQEVEPDYRCCAFRAGGYSICQSTSEIIEALIKNGIKFDSSIIKGFRSSNNLFNIDFRKMPSKSMWFISPDQSLSNEADHGILELPITSMPVSISYILNRRISKIIQKKEIIGRKYQNTGRGYNQIQKKRSIVSELDDMTNPVRLSLDGDHTRVTDLMEIIDYNIKKYRNCDNLILTAIGHPKSMGNYHLELLKNFILQLKRRFKDNIEFTTYSKLLSELNEKNHK